MSEQLPRFEVEDEYSEYLHKQEDGQWVRFSDYEQVVAEREKLREEQRSAIAFEESRNLAPPSSGGK
jgi:hypothetical protein